MTPLGEQTEIVCRILRSYPPGADQAVADLATLGVSQTVLDGAMHSHGLYIRDQFTRMRNRGLV